MDIKLFLKHLYRYKWVLIIFPIASVVITYFLVQNLPKEYSSDVQISTGLLDPSKKVITEQNVDFFQISQQFGGIIEKMKMKKVMNLLSYKLVLHDLEQPNKRFRKYSEKVDSLSQVDRAEVIRIIKEKYAKKEILTLADNDGRLKILNIVSSMGYGDYELQSAIEITHKENSDFINIEYTSENPNLSAYVVNTLAQVFISNYSYDVNINQNTSISLLDSLLSRKEKVMNEKNNALSSFKRTKGVLNLNEQATTVYGQISQIEAEKTELMKQIQSNIGALSVINKKLKGSDPLISGSSRSQNRELVSLTRQREAATKAFVDGGFKSSDQRKIDSLNKLIDLRSDENDELNVVDPKVNKQALITQKTNLDIALQSAKSSVQTLDDRLNTLKAQYSSMVPYDADIQNYERDAELATNEYRAALNQYNTARTEQNMGLRLQIDQIGLPGLPLPSKKIIYLSLSGILSFFLVFSVVGGLFLLDKTIINSAQLAAITKAPVLGNLNLINTPSRSIRNIWNTKNEEYEIYKNLLRSLRFEISKEMSRDSKNILGVTSLRSKEGKTYIAYNLAYAFAMTGKKVLLIGEEPEIGNVAETKNLTTNANQNFESFLIKKEIVTEDLITILSKNNQNSSILEIQDERNLKNGFDVLKEQFDIIIIDINDLHDNNISKEWLSFSEKTIAVFEAGKALVGMDAQYAEYLKNYPGFIGWVLNKLKLTETKDE